MNRVKVFCEEDHPKRLVAVLTYTPPMGQADVNATAAVIATFTPHAAEAAEALRKHPPRGGLAYFRRRRWRSNRGNWRRQEFVGVRAAETRDGTRLFEFACPEARCNQVVQRNETAVVEIVTAKLASGEPLEITLGDLRLC